MAFTVQRTDRQGNVYQGSNPVFFGSSVWVDNWTTTYSSGNLDFPIDAGTLTVPEGSAPVVNIYGGNTGEFVSAPTPPQNYAQERSDLKADKKQFKNEPVKYPGLTPCVKDYLSKFFDRSMLNAITWDHGIPWYVPMRDASAFTLDDMIYFGSGQYDPLD